MKKGFREIAGRFFVFGIASELEKGAVPAELSEWIEKGVSGIILFGRNIIEPLQTWNFTQLIRSLFPYKPFIMSDEEGGDVKRLTAHSTRGINAMGLAATMNPENAFRMTQAIGGELRTVGINITLSPVLDVNCESGNPVIGSRAFSDNPQTVIQYARKYAQGFHSENVLTTGKHFPGHGATTVDSHLDLPRVDLSRKEIEPHLLPFKTLAEEGLLDMIMTAHILYPQISPFPATLSDVFLTHILREEMGFDGLAITDCMEMNAMRDHFGVEKASIRSFRAGADLILISHTPHLQRKALNAFIDAVENGEIPYLRVQESLERIERTRVRLCEPPAFSDAVKFFSGYTDHLDTELARQSLVLYRGQIPSFQTQERVIVFDFIPSLTGVGEENASSKMVSNTLSNEFETLEYYALPYSETARQILETVREKSAKAIVITRSRGRTAILKVKPVIDELCVLFPDNVHLSARDPYDMKELTDFRASIASFGLSQSHLTEFVKALRGQRLLKGQLPVKL